MLSVDGSSAQPGPRPTAHALHAADTRGPRSRKSPVRERGPGQRPRFPRFPSGWSRLSEADWGGRSLGWGPGSALPLRPRRLRCRGAATRQPCPPAALCPCSGAGTSSEPPRLEGCEGAGVVSSTAGSVASLLRSTPRPPLGLAWQPAPPATLSEVDVPPGLGPRAGLPASRAARPPPPWVPGLRAQARPSGCPPGHRATWPD